MYYTQEQIDRANQADLISFLQSQGEQLTRAGNEYRWKRHDSLTIRGNKWYRHSQSKGGGPVDFVMEFFGKSFTEAVELLTGEKGAAPPPDRPSLAPLSDFRLPPRSPGYLLHRLRENDIRAAFLHTAAQAASLAERYGAAMPPEALELCRAFAALPDRSKAARLRTCRRCGFYKQGFARRLGQVLFW